MLDIGVSEDNMSTYDRNEMRSHIAKMAKAGVVTVVSAGLKKVSLPAPLVAFPLQRKPY